MTDKEMQEAKYFANAVSSIMPEIWEMIKQKAKPEMVYHAFIHINMIAALPVQKIITEGGADKALEELVHMARNMLFKFHEDGFDLPMETEKLLVEHKLIPTAEERVKQMQEQVMTKILENFEGGTPQ